MQFNVSIDELKKEYNDDQICIIKYYEAVRNCNQPLYDYEKNQAKNVLEYWKQELIKKELWQDMMKLSDVAIIVKYKIKPSKINLEFMDMSIEDIKRKYKL